MLISHQHKFIFIHVHKTGGNSIKLALRQVINPPEILLSNFFPCHTKAKDLGSYEELIRGNFQSQENLSLANRKVLTMLQKKIEQNSSVSVFDRLSTANYFKFAFVRNPWTHQVSLYNHILRNPNHFQYQVVKKLGNFNNYLDWLVHDSCQLLQKDFVTDDHGKIIVDFVGRFEKLQADFQTICKQLNLVTKLPHANRNLDVKKPYKDYYNKETQQMVAAYFQEDIEFFNYSFPD